MKRRLVYTIYIEPDESEFTNTGEYHRWDGSKTPKDVMSLNQFKKFNLGLKKRWQEFARENNAELIMVELSKDDQFNSFRSSLVGCDVYQALNMYKLVILESFALSYDQILYVDLDVVPLKYDNIFNEFKGTAVRFQEVKDLSRAYNYRCVEHKFKSLFNLSMHTDNGIEDKIISSGIVNTGVILTNQEDIASLRLVADLQEYIRSTNELSQKLNNEVYFTQQLLKSNINYEDLGPNWHFIYDNTNDLSKKNENTRMVHVICKRFEDLIDERGFLAVHSPRTR